MSLVYLLRSDDYDDFQVLEHLVVEHGAIDQPLDSYKGMKVFVLAQTGRLGVDLGLLQKLESILSKGEKVFEDSIACIHVSSDSQLFTKSFGQKLEFILNSHGARFMGYSFTEHIKDGYNLRKWARVFDSGVEEARLRLLSESFNKLHDSSQSKKENQTLLVLHSNSRMERSNTHTLWKKIEKHLMTNVEVIQIEDGSIADCYGCEFKTCAYFGENGKCYYGGIMVDKVLPSFEKADGILWLVPNYNDGPSAKIMALINRLTVFYRKFPESNKKQFAVIVSGNSGSDSVAMQLIGSLSMNKGCSLPPYFYLQAIANSFGEIEEIQSIDAIAKQYARHIDSQMEINVT